MKRTLVCLLLVAAMLCTVVSAFADYPLSKEGETFKLVIRIRPLHSDANDMELFKRLEELTNIHIEWDQIQQAEYDETKNLMLSANRDLPEGFFGVFSLSASDLVNYGSQGVLLPLNDLIEEHAPNLKALFERRPDIKKLCTAPDGNIYATPRVQAGEDGTIGSNMMINMVWLKNLGLEKPVTMEDLEKVLTAFKEQDANGNGDPNDEIPMTFKFYGSQRDIGPLFGAFGYPDTTSESASHIVIDNGKLVYVPATEGYKEGCKYLYEHFFAKGLIDKEGFTMDKKTYNAQNQGEIANIGLFMCWNAFDLGTVHMDEYEPLSPLLGPDGTTSWGWTSSNTSSATGFSITDRCHNPELLIEWVDTFYDPYWGMQCDLGPIGINLIDNGDGTYSYVDTPEGMSYDEFRYKEAFASDGPVALTRDLFDTVIPRSSGHQDKFDRNEQYYRKYAIYQYLPTMLMTEEDNDALIQITSDLLDYTKQYRAKWLANGGVEEEWDEYLQGLKSRGLDEYLEINQRVYDNAYGD